MRFLPVRRQALSARRIAVLAAMLLLALSLAGFGAWLLSLPLPADAEAPPVPRAETEAMLAALKPPRRARPLVAVVGLNDATETTDYLMPTGILRSAGVAEVWMLATGPGPVRLYPALAVQPDAVIADFDRAHPDGADYVIVPAMSRDDDPAVLAWLRSQASKGAIVIGVCAGAKVVAAAGLLDGRRATTHWYYLPQMLEAHPRIRHAADRRMVIDRGVATTTGISASMPMMLTLVEAIAGRARAEAVARELGVAHWDARHASAAFRFTRPFAATVLANRLAFWRHEPLAFELGPGFDEVSLALAADAWSRTYRSRAITLAASGEKAVEGRDGIRILPDDTAARWPPRKMARAELWPGRPPAQVLDRTLDAIGARYGRGTADMVAMQLEYPRAPGP